HHLRDVVEANLKRLQEALRSLEEYGKLGDPTFACRFEAMRYRSYTLEKALLLGESATARLAGAHLYVILTYGQCRATLDWTVTEAAAGGAQIIQMREKSLPDAKLLERAQ